MYRASKSHKSELGQFFTPPKIKKLLVDLVKPIIKNNGEIESVMDPASGTGGILNTIIKHYKKLQNKNKISNENLKNIYGMEIKGKIYNLCLSNMLINTGEILQNVICSDSIRNFHNIKTDIIVANPPFSVTINYDELLSNLGSLEILNNYVPIKTGGKNSEMLFLQMMIYCLNINGRCATVMLDGQKMYGNSCGYEKIREYLMKSCILHEVILCPAGTFTSTASKTCILFFTKKKERNEVLEIKGTKRELIFNKEHMTTKVKFYNFEPETEKKIFIKEVDINDIAKNKYSLNYTEYNIEEENNKDEKLEYIELSKLCDINIGGTPRRNNLEYFNGTNLWVSIRDMNCSVINNTKEKITDKGIEQSNVKLIPENTVLYSFKLSIGKIAITGKPLYTNEAIAGLIIQNKNKLIMKYLYYSLFFIKSEQLLKGCIGNGSLNKSSLGKLKIPIITFEKQNKIVDFLDKLYENKQIQIQDTIKYYSMFNIFNILLSEDYEKI